MKKKLVKKDIDKDYDIFQSLIDTNIEREKVDIFCDPVLYFGNKYTLIKDATVRRMFKINVFFILKKVSTSINNLEDDKLISIRTKTLEGFVGASRDFYAYMLECLTYLITEQDNMIMDTFNEGKISKDDMLKYLKIAQDKRGLLIEEQKEIEKTIEVTNNLIKDIANPI